MIDDDAAVRELVKRSLSKEGLDVMTASGGKDGLELARKYRPDVITLDVSDAGYGWLAGVEGAQSRSGGKDGPSFDVKSPSS